MKTRLQWLLAAIATVIIPQVAPALLSSEDRGTWPADWPQELEPFRKQARTIGVANGTQENIYEIRFNDRAEFDRAWPAILKIKTAGSPITLYSTNAPPPNIGGTLAGDRPVVRIYGPSEGSCGVPSAGEARTGEAIQNLIKQGKMLHAGPPWPAELWANGTLPEYVVLKEVNGKAHWVPADSEKGQNGFDGFHFRARVDLALIIDGNIIDWKKVSVPPATPIVDKRAEK